MPPSDNIIKNSDSLIELLGAQCSDLEKLLELAREETIAAEEGKFLKIWDIVSERAKIGKRLETYHQQIAELRGHLESQGENVSQFDITNRVIELANQTLVEDQKTRVLLTDKRDEAVDSLNQLRKSNIGNSAYLREKTKGLAYSRSF
jgi:flagellar biosynthesis/type III secretory pathway chaperone